MIESPWVNLRDVVHLFGVTYQTAKNRIYAETFPVPVRREGKMLVVDREVLRLYFEERRAEDIERLRARGNSTSR